MSNLWNSPDPHGCDNILEGWERSEASNGVPYYVNHRSARTQWDHPIYVQMMEELDAINDVRYAAYRTAMKLRLLQKRFTLDLIELRTINAVFSRHGFRNREDMSIDCVNLHTILTNLCSTNKVNDHTVAVKNPDTIAEILLNWLLNLYDVKRTGLFRVSTVKIALALLSCARVTEKYAYFFSQLADASHHISRKKMTMFLQDIIQIPELINESIPFGGLNIAPAVESCFNTAWKPGILTEDEFLKWLLKEPQTVVWLPTLHRLAAADTVKHEAKCSICKAFPIIGFRYRCLKCFNYDICQLCFFTGRFNKKHKIKHPTQEYCYATTAKQDTKDFMKTVRNNISKKHRSKKKLRYLPIKGTDQPYSVENDDGDGESVDSGEDDLDYHPPAVLPKHPAHKYDDNSNQNHQTAGKINPYIPNYTGVLRDLEHENRMLKQQLQHLSVIPALPTVTYPLQPLMQSQHTSEGSGSSEHSEVEWLREERERMEAKQEVLESHNKQLEQQLYRLRLLIKEDAPIQSHSLSHTSLSYQQISQSPNSQSPANIRQSPANNRQSPANIRQSMENYTLTKSSPPPYHPTPTGRPTQPFNQLQASSFPNPLPLVRRLEPPANEELDNVTFENLTLDQTDSLLQQTHYSLPSPSRSRHFPDEEAELQEMMTKLDDAFPVDMTHSLLHTSKDALDEMFSAANKIGAAFSGFVGNCHDKGDDQPDGEEDDHIDRDPCFLYDTADMTNDSNTGHSMQLCHSTATPCLS